MGCSNGSEAYTISSELLRLHRNLGVQVTGYDISAEIVNKARSRVESDEVLNNTIITAEFMEFTFERDAGSYHVRPEIAARVTFEVAEVLSARFPSSEAAYDIVFAQNFIFHMKPRDANLALRNILRLTRSGGALFLVGVDLDVRQRFVRRNSLVPLDFRVEAIHAEARRARAAGWPDQYWGLEPYLTFRRNAISRYATVLEVRDST
jgi:chemotaxis methyl-accepting protein methylase